jgi:cyanobactin biosynthesis protein (PatB/AcyB/McaB family)
MRLPLLSPPVQRPDIIYPHRAVDVIHGRVEDLVGIRMDLLHGANYNDPAAFANRSYQQFKSSCGCGCRHL